MSTDNSVSLFQQMRACLKELSCGCTLEEMELHRIGTYAFAMMVDRQTMKDEINRLAVMGDKRSKGETVSLEVLMQLAGGIMPDMFANREKTQPRPSNVITMSGVSLA